MQLLVFWHLGDQVFEAVLVLLLATLLLLLMPLVKSFLLLLLLLLQVPFHVRDFVLDEVEFLVQLFVLIAIDEVFLSRTLDLHISRELLLPRLVVV